MRREVRDLSSHQLAPTRIYESVLSPGVFFQIAESVLRLDLLHVHTCFSPCCFLVILFSFIILVSLFLVGMVVHLFAVCLRQNLAR